MRWGRTLGVGLGLGVLGCGHGAVGTDAAMAASSSTAEDSGAEGSSAAMPGAESSGSTDADSGVDSCDASSMFDVVYAQTSAAQALTTLDVLVGDPAPNRPIVVWVHGGGWVGGDKASHELNPALAEHFADRGEVFVSVNYRLVDHPDSPGTTFAEQAADVAAAVSWVIEHADSMCGDPERVYLIGFSAGAHLVALIAADGSYLGVHGASPSALRSVTSLDVSAYDIPWAVGNAAAHGFPAASNSLPAIFGPARAQAQASPINFIEAGAVPASLVISAPDKDGVIQTLSQAVSERYVQALTDADNEAQYFNAVDDSHASLAMDFGVPGDEVTAVVDAFVDAH